MRVRVWARHALFGLLALAMSLAWSGAGSRFAQGQEDAEKKFDAAMAANDADKKPEHATTAPKSDEGINILEMALPETGGIFMYPIYAFSFLVVLFSIERAFALRRRKIIPDELIEGFGSLANNQQGFDPRKAYRLCQQYPSTAANVIKSTLLKIGRPHSEVEHAVSVANEREAAKLYVNVRPLNLSASVAPLLGLLGTVQGMIMAFFATAHLPDGSNKATVLAQGVYVALITTFAGLCVAIPAVCVSHFYEGKIQRLFREIDELVYNLLPQLERYEGKLRVSSKQLSGDGAETKTPAARQPAATPE